MKLTVYGSFNCPYSFLASLRVERLSSLGLPTRSGAPSCTIPTHPPVDYLSSESSRECSTGSSTRSAACCESTSPTRPDVRRCSRIRRSPSRGTRRPPA
jgi:hypothetical protein